MAKVTSTRRLGRSQVEVTELGCGGASMGELFVRVTEADAQATLACAWDAGVRYFDTAPWYARGLSELRTGAGLRDRDRSAYALSTKVGRWLRPSADEGYDGA
jgi:D-threo-aldose 1-dehydrogenase